MSLQSVYLKDCSYESPNGPRLPNNQAWEPKFQLNMNTSAEELAPDVREVLLTITLEAKQGEATLYLVEVKQAGVFAIVGASQEDLKRLIGSFCPSVLFPYAREVISDLVIKGGFPNFLLPLVNFDALFAQASETAAARVGQLAARAAFVQSPQQDADGRDRRRLLGNGSRHPAARARGIRPDSGAETRHSSRRCSTRAATCATCPQAEFPAALDVVAELRRALEGARDALVAVPSHAFRATLSGCEPHLSPQTRIAWATKGFEIDDGPAAAPGGARGVRRAARRRAFGPDLRAARWARGCPPP